jgi:hypothetical protein
MPHLTDPEEAFRRLSERVAGPGISVDDLVKPAPDRLAETGIPPAEPALPLKRRCVAGRARGVDGTPRAGPGDTVPGSSSTTAARPSTASGKTPGVDPARLEHPAPLCPGRGSVVHGGGCRGRRAGCKR